MPPLIATPMPTWPPTRVPTRGWPAVNGGFETGDFSSWVPGASDPAFKYAVVNEGSNRVARLGDPAAECEKGAPKNGAAWFSQTVTVPSGGNPVLRSRYRVQSQDDERFEALDVSVRDVNGQPLDQVLHAGAPQPATMCDAPAWDSGWRERQFSLALYREQTVQLYFELRSKATDNWFNTWAYVDDVTITP